MPLQPYSLHTFQVQKLKSTSLDPSNNFWLGTLLFIIVQVTESSAKKLPGGYELKFPNEVVAELIDNMDKRKYSSDIAFDSVMILQITETRMRKISVLGRLVAPSLSRLEHVSTPT